MYESSLEFKTQLNHIITMKRRTLLLSLLLLVLISGTFARKVEVNDAIIVAKNQYANQAYVSNAGSLVISETIIEKTGGEAAYYAFNFKDGGFVIVSAEDTYVPVLGYSLTGSYTNDRPESSFRWVMEDYKNQIAYLRNNKIAATPEIAANWQMLLTSDAGLLKNGSKGLEPLLPCTWNQDDPYNEMCPASTSGPGGHVYAGCVATAMAQIMYYWRWPVQGSGQHSYYLPPYGTISANFGATTYDWNGMVNSSPVAQNLPIAELQFHCGVSVNMGYGPGASGAYSDDVPYAAKTYFLYSNSIVHMSRQAYSATVWENHVKGDLDLGYPVYYSGQSPDGGHAFVVDGYDDSSPRMYHFNFGWDGYSNGYYSLANAGGFTSSQGIVKNFIPGTGYPYYAPSFTEVKEMVGTVEDGSGPVADYQGNTDSKWYFNPQTAQDSVTSVTISFNRFDLGSGDVVRIYNGADVNAPLVGEYTGTTLPPSFTSTGNKALVHFITNGSGNANGFFLNFTANRPNYCIGTKTYSEYSGSFDDGSGTFYYSNNSNCMFKINPLYASEVTLYFDSFETETTNDWLKVYDLKNSQLLAEYSGVYTAGNLPAPVTSPHGQFLLIWKSDGSTSNKGWSVHYETLNVGVESQELLKAFHLYPNPASDKLNISFDVENTQSLSIRLTDANGKTVYTETLSAFSGTFEKSLDVARMAKGIYFLNVTGDKGIYNRKVIIN
jgi:hypothetical protein